MIIKEYVYYSILSVSMQKEYETGGIVGGINDIISIFQFDYSLSSISKNCYIPNINKINNTISLWQKQGITFYGIFHSHLDTSERLSSADTEYIRKIMLTMPDEIKQLYFPLVLPKRKKIIAYKATRYNGKIDVIKDDVENINN